MEDEILLFPYSLLNFTGWLRKEARVEVILSCKNVYWFPTSLGTGFIENDMLNQTDILSLMQLTSHEWCMVLFWKHLKLGAFLNMKKIDRWLSLPLQELEETSLFQPVLLSALLGNSLDLEGGSHGEELGSVNQRLLTLLPVFGIYIPHSTHHSHTRSYSKEATLRVRCCWDQLDNTHYWTEVRPLYITI